MVKNLYVIVHDFAVRISELNGNAEAKETSREIERIKQNEDYLPIKGLASKLHPYLPPPDADVRIRVCGAYKYMCCTMQLYALRKKGYRAYFHRKACFDIGKKLNTLPKDLEKIVPEFFD